MATKIRFGIATTDRSRFHVIFSLPLVVGFIAFQGGNFGTAIAQSKPRTSEPQQSVQANHAPPTQTNQASETPEGAVDGRSAGGDVVIDGRVILTVYQPIGSFTAKDRAQKITERILEVANRGTGPDTVSLVEHPIWTEISADGSLLLAVTDEDAKFGGKTRAQIAAEDAESIRDALSNYRGDHAWKAILRGIIYSIVATLVLLPLGYLLGRLHLLSSGYLEGWIKERKGPEKRKTAFRIATTYVLSTALALGSVVRWLVFIALFEIYVTVLLSFFPQTRSVSHAVTGWILSSLRLMGNSALDYLPNLFVIAVVILVASQISRLISMVFDEIGKGNLSIKGFYSEWAEPSAKLIRMLVWVLVLVVIFPYLPGSKSPAFQGISIFVGVLLSLGSSSAVANAIAGVILTYMRSFAVGDWVKIGETIGEVQERSMWVTRILTQKHEVITIPNATILSGSVMNYTREAKNSGVIFHTTVTIGYDAPWKTVHQLLINAALATEHVLRSPAPFVLQTQLNDFYVAYELNAHTENPRRMQLIYSDLHQNIQDQFNEAGVEICSPHFAALRDGNAIAIPEQYVSKDYAAPGFRIDGKEREAEQTATNIR